MNALHVRVSALFSLLACFAVIGCKKAEPEAVTDAEMSSRDSSICVVTWKDYLSPTLIKRFCAETGIGVRIVEIDNSDQLRQYLETDPSGFDVAIADEKSISRLIRLGLLSEIDTAKIRNIANLSDDFMGLPVDPENKYSVPYLWGLVVMCYRKDLIDVSEASWNLLWDSRVRGRVGLLDEPEDLLLISLVSQKINPLTAGEPELDLARRRIFECFNDMGGKIGDFESTLDRLESGELAVTVAYNGDGIRRARDNPLIGTVIPVEGGPFWLDSFAIGKESLQIESAHAFLDFMLSTESGAVSANELRHATPNRASLELVDPELLNCPALFPSSQVVSQCRDVRFPEEMDGIVARQIVKLFDEARQASVGPFSSASTDNFEGSGISLSCSKADLNQD